MSEKDFLENEEMQNLHLDLETVKKFNVVDETDISEQVDDYEELVEDYQNIGYTKEEAQKAAEDTLKSDKT